MTRQEITEFYREHHRRLFSISLRILHDPDEAEEVMQDTLLKYISSPGNFSSDAQVSAWLARTCIRASIDRLRRRERRNSFLKDYARWQDDTDMSFAGSGETPSLPDISQVKVAMDALPDPYRLVLDLVLIEGLDYGEIAALTGRKEPTLRSLYSRGRCKLLEMLKKI